MGFWSDAINQVLASVSNKALLYALRDSAAGAAPDESYIPLQVDGAGNLKTAVAGASGPLPTGAATEAKQDDQITHLAPLVTGDAIIFGDDECYPVRVAGPTDVEIVGAPPQSAAVGTGSLGVPVRMVNEADIAAIRTNTARASSGPEPSDGGIPVRQVGYGSGRAVYRVSAFAITLANAGQPKSLLAFNNATGATVRIISLGLQNAQTASISGAIAIFSVRRSPGSVIGGAGATVIIGPRGSAYADLTVAGVTWVTGGALSAPTTLDSRRLSTDEVLASTPGEAFDTAAFRDMFDFRDDPIAVLNGECADLQIGAVVSGQYDVHFMLET